MAAKRHVKKSAPKSAEKAGETKPVVNGESKEKMKVDDAKEKKSDVSTPDLVSGSDKITAHDNNQNREKKLMTPKAVVMPRNDKQTQSPPKINGNVDMCGSAI